MILDKSLKNLSISDNGLIDFSKPKKFSVLFILKTRDRTWNPENKNAKPSSGLLNSANFAHEMLIANGIKSNIVHADNNKTQLEGILKKFNPDIVIFEAIWISYDNLKFLMELPKTKSRKWIIRCHSETPFLVTEGDILSPFISCGTLKNTYLSCNSPRMVLDLNVILKSKTTAITNDVLLLPNYYLVSSEIKNERKYNQTDVLNMSCFGAIRPLKNHAQQAVAAIMYANEVGKKLRFHINSSRIEGKGEPVLNALRGIFRDSKHELVEHLWMEHDQFCELCKTMDVGLQVSFTETFNIVAADHILNGVPMVGSKEIPWISEKYQADPCDAMDIKNKISYAIESDPASQLSELKEYIKKSEHIWVDSLTKLYCFR